MWPLLFNRVTLVIALVAFAFASGQHRGASKERARCDAASLRAQVVGLGAALETTRRAAAASALERDEATKAAAANAQRIADYENALRRRPAAGACRLDRDDARRLRDIR